MRSRRCHPSVAVGRAEETAAASGGREYLYAEQLAALTPWTPDAIETMKRKGRLKAGVHYFQPFGRGRRLIFKWSEIVKLIEGAVQPNTELVVDQSPHKGTLDVEKAASGLRGLLP